VTETNPDTGSAKDFTVDYLGDERIARAIAFSADTLAPVLYTSGATLAVELYPLVLQAIQESRLHTPATLERHNVLVRVSFEPNGDKTLYSQCLEIYARIGKSVERDDINEGWE
jgi:hypothetical protein